MHFAHVVLGERWPPGFRLILPSYSHFAYSHFAYSHFAYTLISPTKEQICVILPTQQKYSQVTESQSRNMITD